MKKTKVLVLLAAMFTMGFSVVNATTTVTRQAGGSNENIKVYFWNPPPATSFPVMIFGYSAADQTQSSAYTYAAGGKVYFRDNTLTDISPVAGVPLTGLGALSIDPSHPSVYSKDFPASGSTGAYNVKITAYQNGTSHNVTFSVVRFYYPIP